MTTQLFEKAVKMHRLLCRRWSLPCKRVCRHWVFHTANVAGFMNCLWATSSVCYINCWPNWVLAAGWISCIALILKDMKDFAVLCWLLNVSERKSQCLEIRVQRTDMPCHVSWLVQNVPRVCPHQAKVWPLQPTETVLCHLSGDHETSQTKWNTLLVYCYTGRSLPWPKCITSSNWENSVLCVDKCGEANQESYKKI